MLCARGAHAVDLAPLRQVITAESPHREFTVSNSTDRILTASASWLHLSASEDGYKPTPVNARAALAAAPWLIMTPAQFTLAPGERQIIQISLKPGAIPPAGERRSHLLIEAGAERTPMRRTSNSGLQVDIGVGISAPVILRGAGKADATMKDAKLLRDANGDLEIELFVTPKKSHSTYGAIAATFKADDDDGVGETLAFVDNVAGYPDTKRRRVSLAFGRRKLGSGVLTLRYIGTEEYAGRIFHEREFAIEPSR